MRRSCVQAGLSKSDAVCGAQYTYAAVTDTWWVVESSRRTLWVGRQTVCKCVLCLYTLETSSWAEIRSFARCVVLGKEKHGHRITQQHQKATVQEPSVLVEEALMNMYSYAHRVRSNLIIPVAYFLTSIVDV